AQTPDLFLEHRAVLWHCLTGPTDGPLAAGRHLAGLHVEPNEAVRDLAERVTALFAFRCALVSPNGQHRHHQAEAGNESGKDLVDHGRLLAGHIRSCSVRSRSAAQGHGDDHLWTTASRCTIAPRQACAAGPYLSLFQCIRNGDRFLTWGNPISMVRAASAGGPAAFAAMPRVSRRWATARARMASAGRQQPMRPLSPRDSSVSAKVLHARVQRSLPMMRVWIGRRLHQATPGASGSPANSLAACWSGPVLAGSSIVCSASRLGGSLYSSCSALPRAFST